MQKLFFYLMFLFFLTGIQEIKAQQRGVSIRGIVKDHSGKAVQDAMIYIKDKNRYELTDENGAFEFRVSLGKYTLSCSLMGYIAMTQTIVAKEKVNHLNFRLENDPDMVLEEVLLDGKSVIQQVRESAYNVTAINTQAMANTTADLADALENASGVKIRRTGGVGSNAAISLNGFTGNHVKVFLDGMPMQGFGSAFQINNIPVNLAERIEIYKGVVPVELGADALGGAINIITNKKPRTFLDASYSYGSFNTHKSNVNFGVTSKSGLTFRLNAFQNYSDNDYKVKTYLLNLNEGVNRGVYSDEAQWFKRFHDQYHNETVIAKVGVVNKSWADLLLIGGTLGNEEQEVQHPALMKIAYGGIERTASTRMGTFEYRKKDLFIDNLTLSANANYSRVRNQNIDTLARQYNWAGNYIEKNSKGEVSYTLAHFNNDSGTGRVNLAYSPSVKHHFSLNNVVSTYRRKTTDDKVVDDNTNSTQQIERTNFKNVLGASYRFSPNKRWNSSVFGKHYSVNITGPVDVSTTSGSTDFQEQTTSYNVSGYGITGSYNLMRDLQLKASFEKTYRLPSERELFGDELIETGDATLEAENSRNVNFNAAYSNAFRKDHHLYLSAGFVYRDIQDYIRRIVDDSKGGAFYSNHGKVQNLGVDMELRYSYKKKFLIGGNLTYQNLRNKEKLTTNNTPALNYNDLLPNVPYFFGNADATYNFFNFLGDDNLLTVGYHLYYTHEFFREWESYGTVGEKYTIPDQLSHDLDLTFSMDNGKYNVSFEARNFTNELLYDNYSLQKPGRSFAVKFRYFFLKQNN